MKAIFASLGLVILACAAAPATAQQTAPLPLRVAVLKQAGLTDVFVARKSGIFERQGLVVDLIEFRTGNEAIAAQQGGQVDVIIAIPGSAMMAMESGFDLVLLSQNETAKNQGPDLGSVQARPDSGIASMKDLAGKTLAVSGFHSQWTVAVQTLLRQAGLTGDNVTIVETPFPAMAQALKNKQIDAAAVIDPFATQMRETGVGKVISWSYVETIPGQPVGAWYARGSFVQKNRPAVERFITAIHEAIDMMNADEARARENIAAFTGLDSAVIAKMPLNRLSWKIEPALWKGVADMMHANGELRAPHRAEEYLSEFVQAAIVK